MNTYTRLKSNAEVHSKYSRTRAKVSITEERKTPSQFVKECKIPLVVTNELSPIVEMLNMSDYTHNVTCAVPVSEPIFQASPSSITIREFEPQTTIQIEIFLRNNDSVARRVKILNPESSFFKVTLNGKPGSKIAPGMAVSYSLSFNPEDKYSDYFCDLICCTEREKFLIPVKALGPRGWIDIPDEIKFEEAPVKKVSTKTLLLRNVGDRECAFKIDSLSPYFTVEPATATLAVQESMQINFSFHPDTTFVQQGEYRVLYGSGEIVHVRTEGIAQELTVRLDSRVMLMDPTYVSLFSQKSFRIINRSEHTVAFHFKQFASQADETKSRMQFADDLGELDADGDIDVDYSFKNDSFSVDPKDGEVWANSEIEITATFSPSTSTEISCIAFCDIQGKESRIPIHLQGIGIGPRIVLSYNVIDIGEVFIHSVSEYDVDLINQGEINANYELAPTDSLFGSRFKFEPSSGVLLVGRREHIKISFSSEILGDFEETFEWALLGTPQPLILTLRGKVIGPTFHIDQEELDFKRVSVGFLCSRYFGVMNTSDIPFRFFLSVPGDGTLVKREFEVIPETAVVSPHGKQTIQIDFIPQATKVYNLNVVFDIEHVGENLVSIPIKAESVVPNVTVSPNQLIFGDCFLRYAYKKVIELKNHSNIPAKYELKPQDEISRCVAKYEVDCPKGVIDPFQQRILTISFSTERLDKVQLPMLFRVIGLEDKPLEVQCIANGIGPNLSLNPTQLKWGEITVLKDYEKTLKVKNESLVTASFGVLIMKRNSRFKANVSEVTLAPGETANIKVTAKLDDVINFKDDLCIVVNEGGEIMVPLSAKGMGTTITCIEYDLGSQPRVDLEFQFTQRIFKRSIIITNDGPKAQTLSWLNATSAAAAATAVRNAGKEDEKKKKATKDVEVTDVFKIELNGSIDAYTMEPGTSCSLDIIAFSRKPGAVSEKLICRRKAEKEQTIIIEMTVHAVFADPVCEFSRNVLDFEYNHGLENVSKDVSASALPLTIKNICALPLQCTLKCSGAPFSIDCNDVDLKPDESATFQVIFDPGYKNDRISEVVKQIITVLYHMGPAIVPQSDRALPGFHPKKGNVDLNGTINYPNLKFDKTELKFGAVLNDTTRRLIVKCTNVSSILANFSWSFMLVEESKKRPGSSKSDLGQNYKADGALPLNSVFDILPVRSSLLPGQSEDVEFVFFGHANHKYKAVALCEVQGGPEYEVKLEGEASSIQYKFDRISLDYGNIPYDKFSSEDIVLFNTGKVKFEFSVSTERINLPSVIKAIPHSGTVQPNDKVKIQIQFFPGMPRQIDCAFAVEVAHFDPQQIKVQGKGIFPHICLSLPPQNAAEAARRFKEAQSLVGLILAEGVDQKSEPAPLNTSRTGLSVENDPGRRVESPLSRKVKVSMDVFLQSNPYIRQVLAEADCIGMRESIMEQIRQRENESELLRPKILFDITKEKKKELDFSARPASVISSEHGSVNTAPPGPGGEVHAGAEGQKQGNAVDLLSYVLSDYVCELGNVIKNSQVSKTFRVTNVGYSAVSFELSKNVKVLLANVGIVFEPDKVNRLPGAPDFESVEFGVSFNSSRPNVKGGPLEILVPVQIRGGPQVNILVKVNVVIPDVDLSTDSIKFGPEPVFCGHCRSVFLQLTNSKEISASWSFGEAQLTDSGSTKATDAFTVVPEKGVLCAGETCNVQVVFHPRKNKTYNAKIPFKVSQNPNKKFLKIFAESENLSLRFEPQLLDMDPILPFVQESERFVTVINESDIDIEFFSVDFDDKYLEEEEILRKVSIFQSEAFGFHDVALLPLRQPGKGMQEDIITPWNKIVAEEEAARQKIAEMEQLEAAKAEEGAEEAKTEARVEGAEEVSAQQGENPTPPEDFETGKLMPVQPSEPELPTINVLLLAHTFAGAVDILKEITSRFAFEKLNINSLVNDLMVEAGITPFMETVEGEEEGSPPKLVAVPGKYVLNPVAEPSPIVKALQDILFPPLEVEDAEAPPPDGEGAEANGQPAEKPPRVEEVQDGWLTVERLAEFISHRLSSLEYSRGVVFDGLECQHLPEPSGVFQAIETALRGRALHVIMADFEKGADPTAQVVETLSLEPRDDESLSVGNEETDETKDLGAMDQNDTQIKEEDEEEASIEEDDDPINEEDLHAASEKFQQLAEAITAIVEPPPVEAEDGAEGEPELPAELQNLVQKKLIRAKKFSKQAPETFMEAIFRQLPNTIPLPGVARVQEVPETFVREIIVCPLQRPERKKVRNFYILTPVPEIPKEPAEGEEGGAEESKEEGDGEEDAGPKYSTESRWIIPAKGSIKLLVRMKAQDTGKCEGLLGFEICGGGAIMRGRSYYLPVRGMCSYPQISQNYQSLYYRKIKTKAEGQIVAKQYIVSKNVFEFGPLLAGKDKEDCMTKYPENQEKFRITNNGLFDLHVDFCFQDGEAFVVVPESLDLAIDETQDITVYAFPQELKIFDDKLICNIKDNPEPVEINISCIGNVPNIVTDIESVVEEGSNPEEPGALKVEFQRLILERKDSKIVTITNKSYLPAKWKLLNVTEEDGFNCGKELSISPIEGVLLPEQSKEIVIGFQALEKAELQKTVTIEWTDIDGLLPEPKSLSFDIVAEAYKIEYGIDYPTEDQILDFKTVKVVDGGEQMLTLRNDGKYEVGYRFAFARPKRSLIARYFRIETMGDSDDQGKSSGTLEAGGSREIKVIFDCKSLSGEEEVNFKDNTDLKCYISELLTGEDIVTQTIKMSVKSVFSKYRVLPQKGISFGALTYNTSKSRTFDIVNQGEFEFEFSIQCITSLVRSRPGTSLGHTPEENKDISGGEPTADGGIKIGNFVVTPAQGTVQPHGEKQTISVLFEATGQAHYAEVLGISVSERDPATDVHGSPYEITGESCIPGLLVNDFLQIFEESAVLRKPPGDPNQVLSNTFIEDDRVLHFGPRLLDERVEVRIKIVNPTKVSTTVDLSMSPKGAEPMAFEVLQTQLVIPMHEHRYATIFFTPTSLLTYNATFEAVAANGTDEKTNRLVFDVRGDGTLPRVVIREPKARNESGHALFNFRRLLLGKSMTLPMVIVNEGILSCTLRFSRVGAWPAPVDPKDWSEGPACFSFTGRGAELFLHPKEEKNFEVTFRPKEVGDFKASLEMLVMKNEFERNIIELSGSGFSRDMAFENLPEGLEDELKFGMIPVGSSKSLTFTISNTSVSKIYKYSFPIGDPEEFLFTPSVGHLKPGESKSIVATFSPKKPAQFEQTVLTVKSSQIEYTDDIRDWDNSMKEVEWVPEDDVSASLTDESSDPLNQTISSAVNSPSKRGKKKLRKIIKVKPEPNHVLLREGDPPGEDEEDSRPFIEDTAELKATAVSDFLRYAFVVKGEDGSAEEIPEIPKLSFAETMMYRTRMHTLQFKNVCKSNMDYSWQILNPEGMEDDAPDAPFSVEPQNGTLAPGECVDVLVKFSPVEVEEYRRHLVCKIPFLQTRISPPAPNPDEEEPAADAEEVPEPQKQPELLLIGRSARPLCHFELVESDWLSSGRRPPTLPTPSGAAIDPFARCLEFESLGTQVRNTKRFFVTNPTNVSYKFRWECEDSRASSVFKCVHKDGIVLSGKKSEMVFEYTPDSDVLMESFWRFEIPEYGIKVPFILVGHVKEPNVFFDNTFCNFSSKLLNHKANQVVKLVNKEHIPFAFAFDGRTYGADEDPPVLQIIPQSGTIAPESELPITIQFMPKLEKNYNFNAVCNVKKKATRLAINVKGEGFDTHCHVAIEGERGSIAALTGQPNSIDFGDVHVNETRVKTVCILNTGKYPMEFEWKSSKNRALTLKPEMGTVGKGEKLDVKLAYHPLTEGRLADHGATLQIINGPKFPFVISASARKPLLNFSFVSMDFGPCFIYRQGANPASAVLRVTNEDSHDIGYVTLFDNLPHLEVDASPTNLRPGQSQDIPIVFMPREVKAYAETIPFEINGLFRVNVEISGSGHECEVSLANAAQFNFSLGAVKIGSSVEKRLKVKNFSPVQANCSIEECAQHLLSREIRVRPTTFSLRPKDSMEIEVHFSPSRRMEPFTENVVLEVAGHSRVLLVLSGSAVGIEVKLDTDMVFFGAVVAHSKTYRKVVLENAGDIGTRWKLTPSSFLPNFSVEPTDGFLNPHEEVALEIAFHPSVVNDDIRRDNIPIFIDGSDPLSLTLTGVCVSQDPEQESVEFRTPVRTNTAKDLPAIQNPTDNVWRLRPVIENEYWTGSELLEIAPRSEASYGLIFRPLRMTATEEDSPLPKQHTGSVFIPKPDGTAVMYQLVGLADPPEAEAGSPVYKEVPCKAWHTEYLPVRNWLSKPQRFTVLIEPAPEGTTSLKCASYIDVPANTERNFALKFHSFVEGSTKARVTFRNDDTSEYLFYEVEFVAQSTPVLGQYDLSTVVRQEKEIQINLINPLDAPVTVSASCDVADVIIEQQYELRPRVETSCAVVYRPLLPCESQTASLRFSSAELGDFVYELRLRAAPAGTERQIQFKTALGSSVKQTFRFRHLLPTPASYECSVDNAVFSAPARVDAAAAPDAKGVEVEVEVGFEPNVIGEVMAKLTVSSDAGGDFVCILSGHGLPPRPLGPIDVPGKANVEFRNPFDEPRSFVVSVDNAAFTAVARLDDVAPRSAVPIAVGFRAPAPGVTLPGKLTVACDGFPPWVYYLKGT